MPKTTSLLSLLLVLFTSISSPAFGASSVLVWPVFQSIEADQTGSALWLENRGASEVVLQIRVLAWKQQVFEDVYAEQQRVVASPPFAKIAAGERQLVRLMRLVPADAGKEEPYRIIIDEIPAPEATPAESSSGTGLRLQMRYLLPLFVSGTGIWTHMRSDKPRDPDTAQRPVLSWSKTRVNDQDMLVIRNTGIVHARLSNVHWGTSGPNKDNVHMMTEGFLGYVLPGSVMRWPLPAGSRIPEGKTLFVQLADNAAPVAIAYGQ